MAKTVAILLRSTIEGDNQFTQVLTYVFLFLMILTITVQTHYLATALKYFDALYVVPVFQCFWITGSTVGGAIFFQGQIFISDRFSYRLHCFPCAEILKPSVDHEFTRSFCFASEFVNFHLFQAIIFPVGVVITLIGVYVLSQRDMTRSMDDEEELLQSATSGSAANSAGARGSVFAGRTKLDYDDASEGTNDDQSNSGSQPLSPNRRGSMSSATTTRSRPGSASSVSSFMTSSSARDQDVGNHDDDNDAAAAAAEGGDQFDQGSRVGGDLSSNANLGSSLQRMDSLQEPAPPVTMKHQVRFESSLRNKESNYSHFP